MKSNNKQVLVLRTHYPDGKGGLKKLRNGKYFSQLAHSTMAFLGDAIRNSKKLEWSDDHKNVRVTIELKAGEYRWFQDSFAKVVCYVKTEEELLDLHDKAVYAGLTAHLIVDSGRTEFYGEATATALAIGPDEVSKIDPITRHLPLY